MQRIHPIEIVKSVNCNMRSKKKLISSRGKSFRKRRKLIFTSKIPEGGSSETFKCHAFQKGKNPFGNETKPPT